MTDNTTVLPIKTDYQAVRAQLEGAIQQKLQRVETQALSGQPKEVADELRGGYLTDTAKLLSIFTPEYFAQTVEFYEGGDDEHDFLDYCISAMNEEIAYLALCAWPNAIGRDTAWSALSFPLEQQWADKVEIK